MLIFFSPAGIQSLLKNFPNFEQGDIKIGTFGPTTAKAVKEAGLRLDCEAPRPEAPSMTAALDPFRQEINARRPYPHTLPQLPATNEGKCGKVRFITHLQPL